MEQRRNEAVEVNAPCGPTSTNKNVQNTEPAPSDNKNEVGCSLVKDMNKPLTVSDVNHDLNLVDHFEKGWWS